MKSWRIKLLLGVILLLICCPGLQAQGKKSGRKDLNKERKRIEERIRLSSQLLAETSYKRDKSLVELALLNQQIKDRETLLKSLSLEIEVINEDIQELNEVVCAMEEDIAEVQEAYYRSVQLTYRNLEEENILLSILSARSVADAYYRAQYFAQFSRYRRTQLERLQKSRRFVERKAVELSQSIEERESLLQAKRAELLNLKQTKSDQNRLFFALKEKESRYRSRLDQQRKALKALIKRIDKSYGVAAKGKNNATGRSFAQSRGSLLWPLLSGKGIVVGKFGITEDPFGNRISNDGIYIRTPKGEKARAVFKGKVTGVQKVPLYGYMVILEHGIYRTVYANLANVQVKKGETIQAGQLLGSVRTDPRTDETVLNFLVYRIPDRFENPLRWIKS